MTTENKKSSFAVLFVDDEEKTRKYFSKAMSNDFDVFVAESVDEAKKILQENSQNIGVVITDQRMPGGNGVILLRHLKEQYPEIIRLLTTAYSDLGDAIDAVNKGEILRYIQKPWDFQLLKTEIAQAMELFELRLEYGKLMKEKISIKNKVTKIDRVKLLIILSKTFSGINCADKSIANFIKDFALEKYHLENEENDNFDSQDFGNEDVLETKFSINIAKELKNKISLIKDFQSANDSNQLSDFIENAAKDFGLTINKSINENDIKIDLDLSDFDLKNDKNIFFAKTQNNNLESCINLLAFYLLIGNFGGEFVKNEGEKYSATISLKEEKSEELSDEELEDVLLSMMLEN